MSDKYDSILKEKKVYEDYVEPHGIFKKFMLFGFFLVFIIIVVSYIIYYNTFLNGETILLNDFLKLVDKYSVFLEGFDNSYDFSKNYMLDGNVVSNGDKYRYVFIRDGNRTKRSFINNSKSVSFYYDGDSNYMKLSNFDKYISVDNSLLSLDDYKSNYDDINSNVFNYFYKSMFSDSIMSIYNKLYTIDNFSNVTSDIRNNFLDFVSDSNYSKKYYFSYNGRPVVKIDLTIDSKGLNRILGNGNNELVVKDDYSIIITTINDAIMNDINSIKVVVNNKTKNTREVYNYDGKDLVYTDNDGVNYKYVLDINKKRTTLKMYKDDILDSVLEGEKENNKYVYNYQFIDKYERYSLEVSYSGNSYNYKIISTINNKSSVISVDGVYTNEGIIEEDTLDVSLYRDISDSERSIISNSLISYLK